MSNKSEGKQNPFVGLSARQSQLLHTWYVQQVAKQLTLLLKNSQSGKVLEQRISSALDTERANLIKLLANHESSRSPFKVKNASLLHELRDTHDVLTSAERKIAILEQQLIAKNEQINALEEEVFELKNANRTYRKRLNSLLQESELQGGAYLKVHFVGRIFVHALKSSFADWQHTEQGKAFKNKDFYTLFPRVLYSGLLKELELLIGDVNYSKINKTVSNFVFQNKGVPVENWPDEDPIYDTNLINQKQSELLSTLRQHHDKRKNFASYLEKKLEKTGFTPMHGKLLINLIQFATSENQASNSLH